MHDLDIMIFSVIRNEFFDKKKEDCVKEVICVIIEKHILYTKNKGKTMIFPFTLSKKEVK